MKVLFFGDIVGKIGRKAIIKTLPKLKKKFKPDLVLANGENLAHGKGVTVKTVKQVLDAGIDYLTSGNHFWSNREGVKNVLKEKLPIIRPANYPKSYSGKGYVVINKKNQKILLINLIGRVFLEKPEWKIKNPFAEVDKILKKFPNIKMKIVDFHAEATGEKNAFGYYLNGRVSIVLGTHTHIQSADERILSEGTAYITDVGMVGGYNSVIGFKKDSIVEAMSQGLLKAPKIDIPKSGKALVNAVLVDIDTKTGKSENIRRINKVINII
ncbi:TIGR00282 family metallophosphoesterase [bacterium]|nr:TIGR00282 family metallophosphoesterase [bacterium]